MPKRIIFSVGFSYPIDKAKFVSFNSDQSLLDADIILFCPRILPIYSSDSDYQGKPLISESDSFRLVEDSYHWLSELKIAFDSGKTIIIFLAKLEEVFIYTGQDEHSGTGKSKFTQKSVELYNNYYSIPFDFEKIVPKKGKEIKVTKDLGVLATYWNNFSSYSDYEIYLEGKIPKPILTTKTGNKVVGAIYEGEKGSIILLPPIHYDEDSFTYYDDDGEECWTDEAIEFGKRLEFCILEIDKILQSQRIGTPPPEWTRKDEYRLKKEPILETRIKSITKNIEEFQNTLSDLLLELEQECSLRRLLYETGPQLEEAVIGGLKLLGFKAEQYKDSESEFDAIFICPEGRFLGEVEGRDNKAVSIEKLSQLERNIHEDFAREEVSQYAKGVLFGNAFRLKPPSDRSEFFTEKCFSGAKRSKVALVRTTDLFNVAKYLKENKDIPFAKKCRESIMSTEGDIVKFAPIPEKTKNRKEK